MSINNIGFQIENFLINLANKVCKLENTVSKIKMSLMINEVAHKMNK